ncbi:hypothetical protein [Dyadobacter psychrotolerans]|uniref:DoxX family protein n=1 Tax=Dyadobacter psychrotolerans TaxID=2541721 RepID=A0A4V2Z476_9BACT|nr:hypothetical protein [Dyadobacter psychrotolerans]TDE15558.1 hypothetical protein E0F88_13730 [Dyadobacter psychrotolerans]
MSIPFPYHRTTWFFKFCECLLAIYGAYSIIILPSELLPPSFWEKYGKFLEYESMVSYNLILISSLIYTWIWEKGERAGRISSVMHHAWLQGIIRYWLALMISTYGFAKILKTQLQSPDYRLDIPMGEVDGFGLTWYYFGYSYTLAVIIALFQIGGSVLLLYRRTTLLGVMILLPVLVNILFINIFYSIATGAFVNSILFKIGLTFLLLVDIKKLKSVFWDLADHLPPVVIGAGWMKTALRFLPIAAAFSLINYYVVTDESDTVLRGTWKVEKITRNGEVVPDAAWLTDSTAYKRIYFSGRSGCAFSPNPYRYKPSESLRGSYQYDSLKNDLKLSFAGKSDKNPKKDSVRVLVSNRTQKKMHLHTIFNKDTLDFELARLR